MEPLTYLPENINIDEYAVDRILTIFLSREIPMCSVYYEIIGDS